MRISNVGYPYSDRDPRWSVSMEHNRERWYGTMLVVECAGVRVCGCVGVLRERCCDQLRSDERDSTRLHRRSADENPREFTRFVVLPVLVVVVVVVVV